MPARATARDDPRDHAAMKVVRQLSPNVVEAFAGQVRIAARLQARQPLLLAVTRRMGAERERNR